MRKPSLNSVSLLLLIILALPCFAQAFFLKEPAATLWKTLLKKFPQDVVTKLVPIGGEQWVKDVLKTSLAQGGKELQGKVITYGTKYGVDALEVIGRSPARVVEALDGLPQKAVPDAIRAIQNSPKRATDLVNSFGSEALAAMIKHPGVGVDLLEKFGKDGITISKRFSTEQVRSLLGYADDISRLSSPDKQGVIERLVSNTVKALDVLERHPKILVTAGGIALFYKLTNPVPPVLGPDGAPVQAPTGLESLVDRFLRFLEGVIGKILQEFHLSLSLLIGVVGLLFVSWAMPRIWKRWKRTKREVLGDSEVIEQAPPSHEALSFIIMGPEFS